MLKILKNAVKSNPDKMSLVTTIMSGLIIVISLLLIKKLNKIEIEGFEENCKPCTLNSLRNEQIKQGTGNKDVDTLFGTPVAPQGTFSYENNQENAPSVGSGKNSLFLFKHNKCSPECCNFGKGTNFSCSGGCVCYNKEQNNIVASRGDGVYPSKSNNQLNLVSHEKIINDKYN